MKKVLLVSWVLTILLIAVGCASEPQKTEEELREEIKAEMEAEAEMEAASEEKDTTESVNDPVDLDSNKKVLDLEDIKVGDEIDGHKVLSFSYKESDELYFSLEGTYEVKGQVTYSDYSDGYVFIGEPTGEESILPFKVDEEVYEIVPPYSGFPDVAGEDLELLKAAVGDNLEEELMARNVLNVEMRISEYSFFGEAYTSPFSGFTIEEIHSFSYENPSMADSVAPPEKRFLFNDEQGFIRYDADELIQHDLNGDGEHELITFSSDTGTLEIQGVFTEVFEGTFIEKDYFILATYVDPYTPSLEIPLIGVVDRGPSGDTQTHLYGWVQAPDGKDWFGSLGSVPGEVVSAEEFDIKNPEDFAKKTVLRQGAGLEAPVRLDILPQTWWGRTLFIFHPQDMRFKDAAIENQALYITLLDLTLENDIMVYQENNHEDGSFTMKGGQPVTVVATDNQWWFALEAADGTFGWVDLEEFDERNLSGFKVFD